MIVIDHFEERLYFASLSNALLAHSSGDLPWVTLNSSDESMAKRMSFRSIIARFEDDGLATSITASGDKSDFAGFQDYTC